MKRVTFIGTGYVGLVSGAGISDFGHRVICADIEPSKIDTLKSGGIPIYEPGLAGIVKRNVEAGRLSFTTDVPRAIQDSEIIFIAVGTPQGNDGAANLEAVESVARTIGENLNNYKVICTKSTVPVGTGRKICDIIDTVKPSDIDYDYVSNPEFLREGAAVKDFLHPDRVVIGATGERAFEAMRDVYRTLYINETPMVHTNVTTAEMIKYASNAFLALKISYINEIANLCEAVGADVHMVAKAMGSDGRISPKFLHPGPGFGGSCFPKDTQALVAIAKEHRVAMRTITAAIETNAWQKLHMVEKLKALMEGNFREKRVAVLGLSFKPETDDIRESASIPMLQSLLDEGVDIRAFDPIAAENMRELFPDVTYCKSWQEAAQDADGLVILTEWNEFRGMDLRQLKSLLKQPVVLDTRNVLNMQELQNLGFRYENVGRLKPNDHF